MEEKKVRYTCPVDDCDFHLREKTELKTPNGWRGHLKFKHNITGEDIPNPNDFVFEVEKSKKTPRKEGKFGSNKAGSEDTEKKIFTQFG